MVFKFLAEIDRPHKTSDSTVCGKLTLWIKSKSDIKS